MKQKQNETEHLLSTEANRYRLLEDAAERLLANNIDGLRDALKDDDLFFFYKGVIQCYGKAMAKWQQERNYSEEEVIKILYQFHYDLVNSNFDTKEEWFEQYKKQMNV